MQAVAQESNHVSEQDASWEEQDMTDTTLYSKSIQKGWEILCVVSMTFPPSKNLESYLNNFVDQHKKMTCANKVDIMSEHVSRKLERICARGAKGKVLTAAEIDRAKVHLLNHLPLVSLIPIFLCRRHPLNLPSLVKVWI